MFSSAGDGLASCRRAGDRRPVQRSAGDFNFDLDRLFQSRGEGQGQGDAEAEAVFRIEGSPGSFRETSDRSARGSGRPRIAAHIDQSVRASREAAGDRLRRSRREVFLDRWRRRPTLARRRRGRTVRSAGKIRAKTSRQRIGRGVPARGRGQGQGSGKTWKGEAFQCVFLNPDP